MSPTFFTHNRTQLMHRLSGGVIVLGAYTAQQRQNDMSFRFEQEANFWYLTGIEQPDWRLVCDGSTGEEWLIAPTIDDVQQMFDGSLDAAAATNRSGIKNVISTAEGDELLRSLAKKHSLVYTLTTPGYGAYVSFALNPAILANKRLLERIFSSVDDCQLELTKLRAIKQPEEIRAISRAVDLTAEAFTHVHEHWGDYRTEYEIEAEFSYRFTRRRAAHAYDPIVASGAHACTLHYTANAGRYALSDMVLIDIGARLDGYAADITRTYGKTAISKRKRAVHASVQNAQKQIIDLIKPGLSLSSYHDQTEAIMTEALASLGLMSLEDTAAYRRYFPHAVSHGLGIDVHDALGNPRMFEPGMVLTVEPGIYIPDEKIGVRLEDNILVTDTGYKNLSAKLSTDL